MELGPLVTKYKDIGNNIKPEGTDY